MDVGPPAVGLSKEIALAYDCEILIAGGGPTGMAAALALVDLGHDVRIVDKHAQGLAYSRAILVNSRTLALLEPSGVAQKIVARGQAIHRIAIRGENAIVLAGRIDGSEEKGPRAITLPQLETEACFREALAARGAAVERPCELSGFSQDAEGIAATLAVDGATRIVRSKYLIGADGFHSVARAALGIAFPILPHFTTMYGADAVMTPPFPEDMCIWLIDEGAVIGIRLGDRLVRFAATHRSAFDALGYGALIERKTWESDFEVAFAVAARWGEGRVWIAGDAAHVHSPVGGRGMNMGIADGFSLARAVHDGDFEPYQRERRALAKRWVEINRRMTAFASRQGSIGAAARMAARGALRAAYFLAGESVTQTLFRQVAVG